MYIFYFPHVLHEIYACSFACTQCKLAVTCKAGPHFFAFWMKPKCVWINLILPTWYRATNLFLRLSTRLQVLVCLLRFLIDLNITGVGSRIWVTWLVIILPAQKGFKVWCQMAVAKIFLTSDGITSMLSIFSTGHLSCLWYCLYITLQAEDAWEQSHWSEIIRYSV